MNINDKNKGKYVSAPKKYFEDRYKNRDDRWSKRDESFEIVREIELIIKELCESKSIIHLLDIGCGRMPISLPFIEKHNNVLAIGIDWAFNEILESYPELMSGINKTGRLRVINSDFLSFESIPKFDIVIDLGTFHHIAPIDWGTYLSSLINLITEDGYFLLESFHVDDHNWGLSKPGGHIRKNYYCHYHNIDSIKSIFGKDFSSIKETVQGKHWEHVVALFKMQRRRPTKATHKRQRWRRAENA
jgi:cyclopropane fatty-acyl-phospholipid synthase-like methyltransferase